MNTFKSLVAMLLECDEYWVKSILNVYPTREEKKRNCTGIHSESIGFRVH